MIQTIIAVVIVATAIGLAIVYLVRIFSRLGRKESSCDCCPGKKECNQHDE